MQLFAVVFGIYLAVYKRFLPFTKKKKKKLKRSCTGKKVKKIFFAELWRCYAFLWRNLCIGLSSGSLFFYKLASKWSSIYTLLLYVHRNTYTASSLSLDFGKLPCLRLRVCIEACMHADVYSLGTVAVTAAWGSNDVCLSLGLQWDPEKGFWESCMLLIYWPFSPVLFFYFSLFSLFSFSNF